MARPPRPTRRPLPARAYFHAMKPRKGICFAALVSTALASPFFQSENLSKYGRDLLGIFGEDGDDSDPLTSAASLLNASPTNAITPDPGGLGGIVTGLGRVASDTAIPKQTATSTSAEQASSSASTVTATTSGSPTTTSSSSTGSTASAASSSNSLSRDDKTWRMVGIAVISVTVIGIGITSVIFFDRWWRTVKEIICCRKRSDTIEELVPDWREGMWDVKPAAEGAYRSTVVSFALDVKDEQIEDEKGYHSAQCPAPASVVEHRQIGDPRELPWDVDDLEASNLHRQLSQRSGS